MDDESEGKKVCTKMAPFSHEGKMDEFGSGLYSMSALLSKNMKFAGKSS